MIRLSGLYRLPPLENQRAAVLPQSGAADFAAPALRDYFELTKPRITLLVVISTAVGYCFGLGAHVNVIALLNVLLSTAMLAAGTATLNQWYERDIDAKMNRTKIRPIPSGSISAGRALVFGVALCVLALIDLATFTNFLAASLGFLTSFIYLFVYTPLKRRGPSCTTVGAVPGAMPPLIGFAAASGHLTAEAWILFGMIFLWQFPHFHAIAWIYREDYARGDIKMLAVVQPNGKALSRADSAHAVSPHSHYDCPSVLRHGRNDIRDCRFTAGHWISRYRLGNVFASRLRACETAPSYIGHLSPAVVCIPGLRQSAIFLVALNCCRNVV